MSEIPISNEIKNGLEKTDVHFEFKSSIENIDQAVDMCLTDIDHLFSDIQLDENEKYRIDYGLRELFINAIGYGNLQFKKNSNETLTAAERQERIQALERDYPERVTVPVKVFLSRRDNVLVIRIVDQGNGFEKTEIADPAEDKNLLNQTGRGIKIIEKFLGTIKYQKTSEGFEARVEKEMIKPQSGSGI